MALRIVVCENVMDAVMGVATRSVPWCLQQSEVSRGNDIGEKKPYLYKCGSMAVNYFQRSWITNAVLVWGNPHYWTWKSLSDCNIQSLQ
jgi:hypothetical protein